MPSKDNPTNKQPVVEVSIESNNIRFHFPESESDMIWMNGDVKKEHGLEVVKSFAFALIAEGNQEKAMRLEEHHYEHKE
jgi:hypothetical protein